MSSSAIRAIAAVLVLLAIILAVVAYKQAQRYAAGGDTTAKVDTSQQSSVPQTLVVVATKPLAVNKPIERDSVALVPVQVAPTEYFTNVDDVVKRTPLLDIDAGAPITPRFFKENNILAKSIPPGHLGLSMKVDDVVGAGGFARPGDVVDVLLFLRAAQDTPTGVGEKGKDDKESKADIAQQARFLLKNALVLSYEDHLVEAPKGIEEKDKQQQQQQRRERTAVLAVPEADVTRVMLGVSMGEVRLALHPQESTVAAVEPPPAAAGGAAATTQPAPNTAAGAASVIAAPGNTQTGAAAPAASATTSAGATPASPATTVPATTLAAVSSMPSGATDATAVAPPPALPLSDAEKAKVEAAKVPDSVITAAELGKVKPSPEAQKKKKAAAARPRVEIYRGTTRERAVYP